MEIEKIFNPEYFALQDTLKNIYNDVKKLEKEAAAVLQSFKEKKEQLIDEAKSLIQDYESKNKNQANK